MGHGCSAVLPWIDHVDPGLASDDGTSVSSGLEPRYRTGRAESAGGEYLRGQIPLRKS
jgi:hypothetical protein